MAPYSEQDAGNSLCVELEGLLKRKPHDLAWAHLSCKTSREINIDVWLANPPKGEVRGALALLQQVIREILHVEKAASKKDLESLQVFRGNIGVRIRSLNNYLVDGFPALPEDATEQELRVADLFAKGAQYAIKMTDEQYYAGLAKLGISADAASADTLAR